jgi:hypothetical protein
MTETKRQYLSEFAVNIYSARWMMTTAEQLLSGGEMPAAELEVSKRCHIYLICKTPIISFSKDSFKYEGGYLSGHVVYSIEGNERKIPFTQEFPLLDGATRVEISKYPHREIHTLNDDDEVIRYLPASAISMAHGMHLNNSELSDLEVLYVGQAFGDGTRSANDRLKSHSTLQKILADAQYNNPEDIVTVLTFEFVPYRIIHQMDGRTKPQISDDRDKARFISILENHLTDHQEVCLVEAALIRYFQPHYNEMYKENFPRQNHKILESCYELDFSALIVEINTEDLRISLFSSIVKPSHHHISKFDLVAHEDRWGFFHLSTGDGTVEKMPNVIPSN